jgi:hypothetical protein
VNGGFFAFVFEAEFLRAFFEGVEGYVFDDGKVEGGVIGAELAEVVAEGYIQRPVQDIFDVPLAARYCASNAVRCSA